MKTLEKVFKIMGMYMNNITVDPNPTTILIYYKKEMALVPKVS